MVENYSTLIVNVVQPVLYQYIMGEDNLFILQIG